MTGECPKIIIDGQYNTMELQIAQSQTSRSRLLMNKFICICLQEIMLENTEYNVRKEYKFMQQSNQAREWRDSNCNPKKTATQNAGNKNIPQMVVLQVYLVGIKKNNRLNLPLPNRPCKGGRYGRSLEPNLTTYNIDWRF